MMRVPSWKKVKQLAARGLSLSVTVLQYGCIYHCVTTYGCSVVVCSGPSMQPTIYTGDVYLVESVSAWRQKIKIGDIVAVRSHTNPRSLICKRIVAMEGDKVYNATNTDFIWVPRGHVWLEGDNKADSIDSRDYGALPYALIQARLWKRLWSSKAFNSA